MGIPCTKETSNRCSADLIMGIPSLELDAVRWFCPKTCGLCTEMAQMETVGGDPIFHYGNERYKFVLPNTGQAVPLLSWTCPKGNQFRRSARPSTTEKAHRSGLGASSSGAEMNRSSR